MSILRNINYMKRFAAFPCATPNPLIVIELGLQALLPVLYELFSVQIVQRAMPTLKEMGSRNAPKYIPAPGFRDRRFERGRGHGRAIYPQQPAGRKVAGERMGPNTFLFRLADLEQKYMLYWLLADLATEFLARWTTLIYQKQDCPFAKQCYKQGGVISIYIDHGRVNLFLPVLSTGSIFSGGFQITTRSIPATGLQAEDVQFMVDAVIKIFGSDAQPSNAHIEIVDEQTGLTVASGLRNALPDEAGGSKQTLMWSAPRNSAHHSWTVILVNDSNNETVGVPYGTLRIQSGFCTVIAPVVPFDAQHLVPKFRTR